MATNSSSPSTQAAISTQKATGRWSRWIFCTRQRTYLVRSTRQSWNANSATTTRHMAASSRRPGVIGNPSFVVTCGSDHRAPRHRNLAIARRRLLDVSDRGKRIVESLDQHTLGREHVVDLTPRRFRLHGFVVVEGVPAGMTGEQERRVRHV